MRHWKTSLLLARVFLCLAFPVGPGVVIGDENVLGRVEAMEDELIEQIISELTTPPVAAPAPRTILPQIVVSQSAAMPPPPSKFFPLRGEINTAVPVAVPAHLVAPADRVAPAHLATPAHLAAPGPAAVIPPGTLLHQRDPRTVIGSSEFFRALRQLEETNSPPGAKFPSPVTARSTLGTPINRTFMGKFSIIDADLSCAIPSCPALAPCGELSAPFDACLSTALQSLPAPQDPAANCADETRSADAAAWAERHSLANPTCFRNADGLWTHSRSLRVFLFRGVYVNAWGHTFDTAYVVDRNGCIRDSQTLQYAAGSTKVLQVRRAVGLLYNHFIAFFHSLVEVIPMFLVIAPFLRQDPSLPILMKCAQWLYYIELGAPIVGIDPMDLNVVCIETGSSGLILADELIQPTFPHCGDAIPELYFELRRRFYLPTDGLPFFGPGWEMRGQQAMTLEEMTVRPDNWVVVLARRPGQARKLEGEGPLREEMERIFGPERVVLFNGSLPILEAKRLFNRAILYVAAHGAAMSNMVFMPSGGHILEIRPRDYNNGCYNTLADACSLHFHLVWGEGNKESALSTDVPTALRELRVAGRRLGFNFTIPGEHGLAAFVLSSGRDPAALTSLTRNQGAVAPMAA